MFMGRCLSVRPLRWLSGDVGNEVVVAVVMQHCDTFPLGYGCDQKVRQADGPDLPPAPQRGLDIECAPPVFIVGGEPFVTDVAVGSHLVKFGRRSGGPAKFELDHATATT